MKTTFNKYPKTTIEDFDTGIIKGNDSIISLLKTKYKHARIIVLECYPGTDYETLARTFIKPLKLKSLFVDQLAYDEKTLDAKLADHLTDDRVFGRMSQYQIEEFYPSKNIDYIKKTAQETTEPIIIYGFGASRFVRADVTLYLDLARWNIKNRYRNGMPNWQSTQKDLDTLKKEKRGFFVEWRVADRIKKTTFPHMDYYIDGNDEAALKMVTKSDYFAALEETVNKPFSMVPFFDPGVWGGQWMKEVCNLDKNKENYAWSFNGIVEENAMYYAFGDDYIESPTINLVFFKPVQLLGDKVHARFGTEFPIRFDFLDTMDGGNLSLQVHPLTEYIQQTFGMAYTQDESYYILDSKKGGVYIGLKDDAKKEDVIRDLRRAENGEIDFPAESYINYYESKPHDHISIPAGTIHCSATNTMVLEISATPYIFTFKMWDWGRLGLDGLPRPIHLDHALQNVVWDRRTDFVEKELLNPFKVIQDTPKVKEIHTGLHHRQFIETRRHEHKEKIMHETHDSVNMMMLVEGERAIIESPTKAFAPFVVNYAETFIIPEGVKSFTIAPYAQSVGKTIKTIKAFVRT